MNGHFFRRCVRLFFQGRVGNSFGIQELRVGQQIADAVIGNYFERGDVGITAEAGIITRARHRYGWRLVVVVRLVGI